MIEGACKRILVKQSLGSVIGNQNKKETVKSRNCKIQIGGKLPDSQHRIPSMNGGTKDGLDSRGKQIANGSIVGRESITNRMKMKIGG